MSSWLKQSTAVTVVMGPFIDDTDGKSAEIALDITEQEVLLSKNGEAFTLKSETTHGVHDAAHNGWYTILLNTTDTNTLGCLSIAINMAGALPCWKEFMVVAADAWDSLFGAVVVGQAGAQAALVANNLDHLAKTATAAVDMTTEVTDGTIISRIISNSDTSLYVPATSNLTTAQAMAVDVHDTDLADLHTDVGTAITAIGDVHATDLPDLHTDVGTVLTNLADLHTDVGTAITAIGDVHATDLPDLHTDVADLHTDLATAITAIGDVHATDLPAVMTMLTDIHGTDLPAVKTDTAAILLDTGTDGVVVATASKTGYALSATGADLILKTADFALAIADAIWDEVLTAALHNVAQSAGKRLRQLGATVLTDGVLPSQAGITINQVKLAAGEPNTAHILTQNIVAIISGTGAGQARLIVEYGGADSLCTLSRDWEIAPVADDEYIVLAFASFLFTAHGIATAGAVGSITLATTALAVDDAYIGSIVVITTGTGAGQARLISDYTGSSKLAAVSPNWTTTPDATSVYAIIPVGRAIVDSTSDTGATAIGDSLLGHTLTGHTTADTVGLALNTIATITGYLDTEVAAILADTGELQTDWVNGGRLDLILDAVTADVAAVHVHAQTIETDVAAVHVHVAAIPTAGAGAYAAVITLHDSGGVDIAGASVWISTDVGGSTVIASGTTSDTGTLTLYLDAATYYLWAQLAGYNFSNPATLVVTSGGATATVTSSTPVGLGTGSVSTVMTIHDTDGADLAGAHVWVSSDAGGATVVASGTSGVDGTVTFALDPATYYCWVQLASYSFTNPTTLTVVT
jgi:hypothetical protein